jgi:alpha-glucosidase
MNYGGFTHPLWYWLSGFKQGAHGFSGTLVSPPWPTGAMIETWQSRMAVLPWAIARQQYNLLDSHDTPRIRATLGENDALHRLAVTVLMTFPGVPGLYYGDEIGMTDLPGLSARGCMVWDEARWNKPLYHLHRDLIHLRRRSSALQRGGFQILLAEADTIAYQRESLDERVIVVAHRGETPRLPAPMPVAHGGIADGTRFVAWASGEEFVARDGALMLPAVAQGAILLQEVA